MDIYRRLPAPARRSLEDYAEFLAQRHPAPEVSAEPLPLERPEEETVVAAIQRLSRTYPMLDKGRMLQETSALMAAHVMQGRPAAEVIDELEAVFRRHYEALRSGSD